MEEKKENKYEKYEDKCLVGLRNLGNSCFLNSCVSVLIHTYELQDILIVKSSINKRAEDVKILTEWNKLSDAMFRSPKKSIISPVSFVMAVREVALKKNMDDFSKCIQNDICEFLGFIINTLHDAISTKVKMNICGDIKTEQDKLGVLALNTIKNMYSKDYSKIIKTFYGVSISTLQTQHNISQIGEPFFTLSMPIPTNATTLFDCIDEYVKPEILDGDDCVLDEKTGEKVSGEKKVRFWSLPDILIIELKRSMWGGVGAKNIKHIDFPLDGANFSSYVDGYAGENSIYNLYGVCNHIGGVNGGHYTAYIKNANGCWYHCNDDSITEIDSDRIITACASCLFYRRV